MKKRNIIILILISIISVCVLTALLIFAYHQNQDRTTQNEANKTPASTPISIAISPTAALGSDTPSATPTPVTVTPLPSEQPDSPIVLGFAGDVNLDENNPPAKKYDSEDKGILGILSEDLLKEMQAVDVLMLNNEFSYSTGGTKTPDKTYTFRADPDRVSILTDMGVDVVSLANNHALDYGQEALLDTFRTLDDAGINYVGAGDTMDRAKAPIYREIGGKKIAFLAASRVVFSMNWYATDTTPGMIGTYDPSLILESIQEAKGNSDFVVIFVHWGVERDNHPQEYQTSLAKQYIDAGADAVIGCHPHVMEGFEYYKGKPIAYSLGNFIFTSRSDKSGFLKLYLDPEGGVRMQLLPAVYSDTYTSLLTDGVDKKDYYDYMEEISYHVTIDKDGFISESK